MFEDFVKRKIESEDRIIESLPEKSREHLLNSKLSEFSKNFIIRESGKSADGMDFLQIIEKSNKLYFNYAIRPKWTLLAFLFNNFESRPPGDILSKLEYFPFYKYYTDSIKKFIEMNSQIFITRSEINSVIDDTNTAIYEKLTADFSNEKIKNFLLQLFILKYGDESEFNLESGIPFSFLRIFLSDKSYDNLKNKFTVIPGISDESEISLKDIIKILNDKFTVKESLQTKADITEAGMTLPDSDSGFHKNNAGSVNVEDKIDLKTNGKKIYSEELISASASRPDNAVTQKQITAKDSDRIKNLFEGKLSEKVLNVIYNSNLISREKSFEKLSHYKTWFEASNHLKEIFKTNNVNIYNKDVVAFVNRLNDYFNKPES